MKSFTVVCFFILFLTSSVGFKSKRSNCCIPAIQSYISELDKDLAENSGLIYWNRMLWTINDSGGSNHFYGIDSKTGTVKKKVLINNALNTDWEDIAQDEDNIYIADTGNNFGNRRDLAILKINKKDISAKKHQEVVAEKIIFSYSDQVDFTENEKSTKYDCEALISKGESLFLFTKDWVTYQTKVYCLPKTEGCYKVCAIDSFNTHGLVTGADLFNNNKLVLVGYKDYKSFIWSFKVTSESFFTEPHFYDLSEMGYAQTEGICFGSKGDVLMSCEAASEYQQQIWLVKLKGF